MKQLLLLVLLANYTLSQNADLLTMPSELKKDFGDQEHLQQLKADINQAHQNDFEEEKRRLMDEFLTEATNALNEHVETTSEHKVGSFNIKMQTKCVLQLPEPPIVEYTPLELECLTGNYEGRHLAEAIASITKSNPQTPAQMLAGLAKCELIMTQTISLTIHNNCLQQDLEKYYTKYFNELITKMKEQDFEYNSETNEFTYTSGQIKIGELTEAPEVKPAA